MSILRNAVMATVLFFMSAFPVFAQTHSTHAGIVKLISEETKDKIKHKDAVRIVNSVFTESKKHKLDPFLVLSLIKIESRYNPRARSSEGALGLTQVIPRWHREKIRGRNILNIETNIEVGIQVWADCLEANHGYIKKAARCYSSNAHNYAKLLQAGYIKIKKADLAYRFENDLPLEEDESKPEIAQTLSTSLKAVPTLALE